MFTRFAAHAVVWRNSARRGFARQLSCLSASTSTAPAKTHETLTLAPDNRVVLIGDVHGCRAELDLLLDKISIRKTDTVVFVGDLVNKGPDSVGVLRTLRELRHRAFAVRGNHDEAALSQWLRWRSSGKQPSKKWRWVEALTEDDVHLLKSLPYTLAIPTLGMIVVHAGFVPDVTLEDQRLEDMIKMRNCIRKRKERGVEKLKAMESIAEGDPWASLYSGELGFVVFGHDARRGLQMAPHALGLDTGCVYGGELTACVIEAGEGARGEGEPPGTLVSVRALEVYEEPKS